MSAFEITKYLNCSDDYAVVCDGFVLGTLRVTLQLGCGRMYFGKEFVEFVISNTKNSEPTTGRTVHSAIWNTPISEHENTLRRNSKISDTIFNNMTNRKSDSHRGSTKESLKYAEITTNTQNILGTHRDSVNKNVQLVQCTTEKQDDVDIFHKENYLKTPTHSNLQNNLQKNSSFTNDVQNKETFILDDISILLYGLIFVSEAQYLEGSLNTYISCQVFCQGDTLCSRVVYNSKEPVFNFYQKIPFLYDHSFLLCMRDNSIVVDFWERYDNEDIAFGTSHLPLHQFFIAYRNKAIAENLLTNRLPVTTSDWWEPICSPVNGQLCGQMKVLVAVGTASQIHNLEVDRGLKNDSLAVTYVPIVPKADNPKKENSTVTTKSTGFFRRPGFLPKREQKQFSSVKNKNVKANDKIHCKKVDIGIQSDADMENRSSSTEQQSNRTESMLESFLTQLIEQKKGKYTERATNTEEFQENVEAKNFQVRKTSDLLDYLNETLGIDKNNDSKSLAEDQDRVNIISQKSINSDSKINNSISIQKETSIQTEINKASLDNSCIKTTNTFESQNFKAQVTIEGALHLPYKKKGKSKHFKKKNYDDNLPSTYVTYETIPGVDLKVSPVIYKSTNPQWDFKNEVLLPIEMLTNNQKRLIFKVWRKNNVRLQSSIQTDVIIGFAALDLTVLSAGLPSVQGWFNIVDFSSKCNGQIKIHVTPLENIATFEALNRVQTEGDGQGLNMFEKDVIKTVPQVGDEPAELLSRALKRKFSELAEITQRLKTRLADVMKEERDVDDEIADEFERDINLLCIEDDYDMINFDSNFNQSRFDTLPNLPPIDFSIFSKGAATTEIKYPVLGDSTVVPSDGAYESVRAEQFPHSCLSGSQCHGNLPTDRHLFEGKQRIDTLLEKLTLMSNLEENSENRYVSGCSIKQEVPKESSNLDSILNPKLFNQLCSFEVNAATIIDNLTNQRHCSDDTTEKSSNSSETSQLTFRQALDGAGHTLETSSISSSSSKINI